ARAINTYPQAGLDRTTGRRQVADPSACWDAVSAPRECPAGSDCYSAAIAVAATSPAITLASRNMPIATSSILSQSASTLPLCCPNSGAGPTAGGASPKRTGQLLIV